MSLNIEDLRIIPIQEEYYEENLKLLNSVIKESDFLARKSAITLEETKQFFDTYLNNLSTLYLIALYKNIVIGHTSCIPRSEELLNHVANIGYLIHMDYRKKGVGSLLLEELLIKAKEKRRLRVLIAEVAKDNLPSIKLLKKFQFHQSGKIENGMLRMTGKYVDLLQFSKQLF